MHIIRPTILVCAGPPGPDGWVGVYPGFAYPSGELQPGLLCEQALRAVCTGCYLLCCICQGGSANKTCCNQPGGSVYVIAQAEAPRRGKRSLGNSPTPQYRPGGPAQTNTVGLMMWHFCNYLCQSSISDFTICDKQRFVIQFFTFSIANLQENYDSNYTIRTRS